MNDDALGEVGDLDPVVVDLDLDVAVVIGDVGEPDERGGVAGGDRHRVAVEARGRVAVEQILELDEEVADRRGEAHAPRSNHDPNPRRDESSEESLTARVGTRDAADGRRVERFRLVSPVH